MRLLLASVMLALVAGCSGSEAGTPRPQQSSEPSTTSTSTAAARPRSLDLNGVDPCTLLTEQQLAAFAVDGPLNRGTQGGASVLAGSPDCVGNSLVEKYGFVIVASTKVGLAEYLSETGQRPSSRNTTVGGFPAVEHEGRTSAPERGSGECYVHVDVADGQLLGVQFSQIAASPDKRLPIETLCAKAAQVAEAALTTLQGG